MGHTMKKFSLLWITFITFSITSVTSADSFRCGRKLVKHNESASALIKKCGKPVRKFSSKELTSIEGRQKRVSVTNWVYERRGKRDMIVSILDGTVIKMEVE